MLIQDIVRRVRESAGDIGVLQFSNASLTDWINDAIREVVIANSLLQARGVSPTVVGQREYTLPSDVFKLHSVWYDNRKLEAITLEQWETRYANSYGEPQDDGTPSLYYVYAGKLNVYPIPEAIKSLTINYSKTPAAIQYAGTSEAWSPNSPDIPEAFHNRLVTYCLAQVALQDDDYNKYQALMHEFQTGMRELGDTKNEDDLYPFINTSLDDAWGPY